MIIAFNTRFLLSEYLDGYGYFLYEHLRRITLQHPEHTFIFIFDRPFDPGFVFSANVVPVVAGPAARHPLLWKYWYDIKVASLLKKYKADVFVSCDGFCSLTTRVPQCLVIHDLAFLHYPSFISKSHLLFYKRYTPRFIKKAKRVVTVSDFSKKDIVTTYQTDPQKIDIIYNAASEIFHPATPDQRDAIKAKYTGHKEFFLCAGAIHPRKNLMNVLKAFSLFKKRMASGVKLVIAGRLAWQYQSFTENLKTYKYRHDVVLTGYLPQEELARLMGAAYALLYVSLWEGFGIPVIESMRSGTPVITTAGSAMQEIAGDAAMFVTPADPADIADKMMQLYKDENLRGELVRKGLIRQQDFDWQKAADQLWASIEKTVG